MRILKKLGVVEIVISGGNPLLREDIGEIIDYASRFFITTVYDNGSMAAEKIDALRKADFVAISIDSLNSEKNDYIKGVKDSVKKSLRAVEKLRKEGINVSVSPTISQLNLYELEDFTKYFLKKGIPLWYCLYSYDSSEDPDQLFKIGKKNDEFLITDRQAMVRLCDFLDDMRRKNSNVFVTSRILEALKNLYLNGTRTWNCYALQNFLVIDHLGNVAGCHLHRPAASIFDLPKVWNSEKFNALRKTYSTCSQCTYLCYLFYSLHGSLFGNLQLAQERWKNAKMFLKRNNSMPLDLAECR